MDSGICRGNRYELWTFRLLFPGAITLQFVCVNGGTVVRTADVVVREKR